MTPHPTLSHRAYTLTPARVMRALMLCLAALPVLALVFWGLLTSALMLPDDVIAGNIMDRPAVLLADRADNGRVIDHHTECIGLSVGLYSADNKDDPAWRRALMAESVYGCEPFIAFLAGEPVTTHRDYFRYWHGHALVSRPLLSVMTYNDMRGALFTLSLALLALLGWRLARDFSAGMALAFVVPFFLLNAHGYWVVATKFTSWMLIIGGGLAMARVFQKPPLIGFFLLGAGAAAFDFLTAPALIFALPAFLYCLYQPAAANRATGLGVLAFAGFWLLGYAGLWSMKVGLAALFFGDAVWADVMGSAANRLRGESDVVAGYWPGAAIVANLAALKTIWGMIAAGFVISLAARRATRQRVSAFIHALGTGANARMRALTALALAPLVFMEILSNHAQIHAAFTQLNLALIFMLVGMLHWTDDQTGAPAAVS